MTNQKNRRRVVNPIIDDFSNYEKMRDAGLDAKTVYLTGKADRLDPITLIRMIRHVFQLSLVEAKEVKVVADGLANSLEEYQEKLIPGLEAALKEMEEWEESESFSKFV